MNPRIKRGNAAASGYIVKVWAKPAAEPAKIISPPRFISSQEHHRVRKKLQNR
jgi:hypothetical protein